MRRGTIPDRAGGLLIALAGAAAIAAIAAVRVPAPAPAPGAAGADSLPGGIPFSATVETVTQLEARAAAGLFDWLMITGWATWAVGVVTILALWADRAARSRAEIVVHRAMGASRTALARGALRQGLWLALWAAVLGLPAGSVAAWTLGAPWSAGGLDLARAVVPIVIGTGAVILLGAAFPLWGARSRRAVGLEPAPTPLGIVTLQLGAGLALVVAGGLVTEHARQVIAGDVSPPLAPGQEIVQVAAAGTEPLDLEHLVDQAREANVAISITLPGGHLGRGPVDRMITDCGQCLMGTIFVRWRPLRATFLTATADTFQARGIPIVAGRGFSDHDRTGAPMVAVVNRQLAHRYFERGQPLGRTVLLGGTMGGTPYQVVGVVDDPPATGLGATLQPREVIYLSALQHPATRAEVLGPAGHPLPPALAAMVTRRVAASVLLAEALAPGQRVGRWFRAEGALALLLALASTSALLILWVRSLREEIALRRAVGARQRDVRRLVLRRALRTGLLGVAIGIGLFGVGLWPELGRLVPGVPAWDTVQVARAAGLLLAATLVAALVPLRLLRRFTPANLLSSP